MQLDKSLEKKASELLASWRAIGDEVIWAKELVRAIDSDRRIVDHLLEKGMNPELLLRLEFYGRDQLDARLLYTTRPGEIRLLACPKSLQAEALENGVEVWDPEAKEPRRLFPAQLSKTQAKQVFPPGRIRDVAEQRTFAQEQGAKEMKPVENDHRVKGDQIIIYRDGVVVVKLHRSTLLQYLQELG